MRSLICGWRGLGEEICKYSKFIRYYSSSIIILKLDIFRIEFRISVNFTIGLKIEFNCLSDILYRLFPCVAFAYTAGKGWNIDCISSIFTGFKDDAKRRRMNHPYNLVIL